MNQTSEQRIKCVNFLLVVVSDSTATNEKIGRTYIDIRAFLVAQMVKNLPAMQETWVRSLGWEDPLENGMATHSWWDRVCEVAKELDITE